MINNKIYYNIAEHLISVEGNVEAMALLDGFDEFATDCREADIRICLNDYPKRQPIGETYYTVDTKFLSCHFTKQETEYGVSLVSHNSDELLSLRYTPADRCCEIYGKLDPALVRLALWSAFGLATIGNHTIAVHASAVVFNEKAILFLGESGTGKSTHAGLWQQHIRGVTLLNDDSPIIRIREGKCHAYGSPWSGKTPCYKQSKVELGAIIRLSQASCNQMERLPLHEAIAALYPSFPPAFSVDEGLSKFIYGILSDIMEQVPVYHLDCLPNRQAVQLAFETISPVISE